MTTTTSRDLGRPARRPALDHDLAGRLADEEYARLLDQLRALTPQDWSRPTSCPEWDVRAMVCHLLGMAEMSASLRQQVHQMRTAGRAGGVFIDALTALQVDERRHLTPTQVVQRLTVAAPRAVRGRRRTPGLLRGCTLPQDQTVTGQSGSTQERWTIGFLVDVILTRDAWMHRTDIADATGAMLELTADHDGVLVADVVQEWVARHGQPCRLVLTGPAGGTWSWASGGPEMRYDAVAFCRALAGRAPADGLLATQVPF